VLLRLATGGQADLIGVQRKSLSERVGASNSIPPSAGSQSALIDSSGIALQDEAENKRAEERDWAGEKKRRDSGGVKLKCQTIK